VYKDLQKGQKLNFYRVSVPADETMLNGRIFVYMAEIQATSQAVLGIISNQQWERRGEY
jgi:hypothetical protein